MKSQPLLYAVWSISLQQGIEPQQLAERPRLERTTAWRVRRIAVRDLGNVAEAGVSQMIDERHDKTLAGFLFGLGRTAADAQPCLDERTDQPWPNGALMIAAVAFAGGAVVAADV